MSQRSRKSKKSLSQPSQTLRDDRSYEDDQSTLSQGSPNKSLNAQEHAHHVANVVKYLLAADENKTPITKAAISKAVDCSGRNIRSVMITAQEALRDIFGYKLVDVDKGKKLILTNLIENDLPHLSFDEETKNRYILLFLCLSHIYMNGGSSSESLLVQFLSRMDIIIENNMKSDTFGDILQLIAEFIKEKYLETEKSGNSEEEDSELKWGSRAYAELPVRSVLEFISKVYGDRPIESWPQQYDDMLRQEQEANEE